MPNNPMRPKVDQSLRYRWGIVGLVLPIILLFWYMSSKGVSLSPVGADLKSDSTRNLVKIVCPRCANDPIKKKDCSLCGGLGNIWVDSTKDQPAGMGGQ